MLELEVYLDGEAIKLQFEHSLLSLSKWEQKYRKPFLTRTGPDPMEMIDYYQCMVLTPEVDENIVLALEPHQMEELGKYINDPMTASSVPSRKKAGPNETVTSELIYYWMVELGIDWQAQEWHLNRLLMLVNITNFKRQPKDAEAKAQTQEHWDDINERQKKLLGTNG